MHRNSAVESSLAARSSIYTFLSCTTEEKANMFHLRERGREGEKKGGREGGRKKGREGGREGGDYLKD